MNEKSIPAVANGAQEGAAPRSKPRIRGSLTLSLAMLCLLLAGLPLAVWLDLRNISETTLRDQAASLAAVIDEVRSYYAENVVGRVAVHPGGTIASANYQQIPGAIPIPATFSLDLGAVLHEMVATRYLGYRFFSDLPFARRAPHAFDDFERGALESLRAKQQTSVYEADGSIFDRRVRLITPVVMGAGCVSCHNTDPESPKRDWKIGDVRGIEEFTISQHIDSNIFAFRYLLIFFICAVGAGALLIGIMRNQSSIIAKSNVFLSGVAAKLAKYLPPQHFRSIFSGEKDVVVSTERKKLTIFFSDVVNFTAATERLQPEELTALLNEYLTEMAQIAARHGGTVNKFIGDAILVFFGDPESRGVVEDAHACVQMAFEMQRRLSELNVRWRARGVEEPFRCRIGINTGYCNVGNFGSDERMDYTIIGAEANLAARLQSIAAPGGMVLSYETFALVADKVRAHALEPIILKGIPRPIVPYEVDGSSETSLAKDFDVITARLSGLDLFLDVRSLDAASAERMTDTLENALSAVRKASAGLMPNAS